MKFLCKNSKKFSVTASFVNSNFPKKEDKENWLTFVPIKSQTHTLNSIETQPRTEFYQIQKTQFKQRGTKCIKRKKNRNLRQFPSHTSLPLLCSCKFHLFIQTQLTSLSNIKALILNQKNNNIQPLNMPKTVSKMQSFLKNLLLQFTDF